MLRLVLEAGRASEVTQPERRAALCDLRARLEAPGVSVDLQITEYAPGRRGYVWSESVAIYIAGAASGPLISSLVTDIYEQAKTWARASFRKKLGRHQGGDVRPESFTIYGPNNEVLKTWKIDRNGEQEKWPPRPKTFLPAAGTHHSLAPHNVDLLAPALSGRQRPYYAAVSNLDSSEPRDIDAEIQSLRQAVRLSEPDAQEVADNLLGLCRLLRRRYNLLGHAEDLGRNSRNARSHSRRATQTLCASITNTTTSRCVPSSTVCRIRDNNRFRRCSREYGEGARVYTLAHWQS